MDHLQRHFFPVFEGGASGENKTVLRLDGRFAQGAAVAFQLFLRPGGTDGAGEEGDFFVAQFQQMPRHQVTAGQVIGFHVAELGAKRGAVAKDDGGGLALP
jgi:hypothetical protein